MPLGLILGLAFLGVWPAQQARAQTDTLVVNLEEAERRALENSPLLEMAAADLELSRAQKTRAEHARILPELSLRNVWGPIPRQRGEFTETGVLISPDTSKGLSDLRWFTDVQLQAVQPITTFGKIGHRVEAAEHRIDVSEAGVEQTRAEAVFLVRQLYWGLLLSRELERVVDDVLAEVAEADEKLQEQYDEGSATQNDLFKFRLFEYEIQSRSREVAAGADEARAGLRAAMGLPDGTPYRLEREVLEPLDVTLDSLSVYMEMARRSRPQLNQLRAGIAARGSLVEANERDAWPTIFVAGEFRLNEAPSRFDPENPFWDDQTNFVRAGVVLGFEWQPNFLQHRDRARIERYEQARLEAQLEPLRARVEQEVREAWLKARRARADVEDGREALQASENWLRAELQTYDIGIGDIEDVISAFRANIEMRVEQLRNIAELNTAVAELSRRVGRDIRP